MQVINERSGKSHIHLNWTESKQLCASWCTATCASSAAIVCLRSNSLEWLQHYNFLWRIPDFELHLFQSSWFVFQSSWFVFLSSVRSQFWRGLICPYLCWVKIYLPLLSSLKNRSVFVETEHKKPLLCSTWQSLAFPVSLSAPCWILSYLLLRVCHTISLVRCWQNALNCYVYLGHFPQRFLGFL